MEFTEQQINQMITEAIDKREMENQYGVARVPAHTHNGTDSFQLDPSLMLGFPTILVADATVAPTDNASQGTLRFYYDATPKWIMWLRINNLWKSVALT